jgi:large subunit ribosomal protein L9e
MLQYCPMICITERSSVSLQKCHVKNKDCRKFMDRIYVSDKGAINEEQ